MGGLYFFCPPPFYCLERERLKEPAGSEVETGDGDGNVVDKEIVGGGLGTQQNRGFRFFLRGSDMGFNEKDIQGWERG